MNLREEERLISEEINSFINSHSTELLQKFDTAAWLNIYEKLDEIIFSKPSYSQAAKLNNKQLLRRLVVHNNCESFCYLYKNFRLSLSLAANIKTLAEETVRNLQNKSPSLFNKLSTLYINKPTQKKALLQSYRNFLCKNFYSFYWNKKPHIKETNGNNCAGFYDWLKNDIYFNKEQEYGPAVLTHEFFHYMNNYPPQKNALFLQKNEPAAKLFTYNQGYYLNGYDSISDPKCYQHQPTEYGAHLFSFEFSRSLNRRLNRQQQLVNNISANTLGLLKDFSLYIKESNLTTDGQLEFKLENLNCLTQLKAQEICETLLHTSYQKTTEKAGSFILPITKEQDALTSLSFHRVNPYNTFIPPHRTINEFLPKLADLIKYNTELINKACRNNQPEEKPLQNLKQKLFQQVKKTFNR